MRFVWAVVAFVLATLLIGAGIAQRTIFLGPAQETVQLSLSGDTPFVLIDGDVLRAHSDSQSLVVRGEGTIFVAYGRTEDAVAWLADSRYEEVSLDEDGQPASTVVEAAQAPPTPAEGEDAVVRNPAGSDLWYDSFTEDDRVVTDTALPEGMSMLVATDGTTPAPSNMQISWPLDRSTPLVGPLIVAGALVLLFGLIMYILAIRHQRRGRGPRRKGPGPLPATEPIDLTQIAADERKAIESSDAAVTTDQPAPRDEAATDDAQPSDDAATTKRVAQPQRRWRRLGVAVPVLTISGLVLAGCSADSWPQFGSPTATPSPTPTVVAPENQKPPAVTEAQAARILTEISGVITQADTDLDIDLAATRMDGAALEARRTDYTLRAEITDRAPLPGIPTDEIEVLLPQAVDTWPRTVLVLAKSSDDETVPPVIFTMTQADQWSNYKVSNMAEMQANAQVPDLAPAWLGTTLITDSAAAFLETPPAELGAAFADVVDTGEDSASFAMFDESAQALAQSIRDSRQSIIDALADAGAAETSETAFDIEPAQVAPVALATLDSGAIVAVSLVDTQTITPTSDDAVIKFGENPEAKALTGVEEASKGITTTYELQLFFSVPTQGSSDPITLLAARQDILGATVIE